RSCIFLETRKFKKNKEGARLYESQSRDRFILLQQALEERGYVEKQANWTLCNAAFVNRRCIVEMDHIEGTQLMPVETAIECFNTDRTKILEGSVKNHLPVEEYVETVIKTVQEKMQTLLGVIQTEEVKSPK
ncbi:MAG: hypothetical protein AAB968_02175, partial [Patescibacteria group bacterium]